MRLEFEDHKSGLVMYWRCRLELGADHQHPLNRLLQLAQKEAFSLTFQNDTK